MLHDCHGSVVQIRAGDIVWLCDKCGRPFAVLNKEGLHITSRHGKEKDTNTIRLKALKAMIAEIEKQ